MILKLLAQGEHDVETGATVSHGDAILSPWRLFYRYDREIVFVLAIIDGRRDIQDILLRRLTRSDSGDSRFS